MAWYDALFSPDMLGVAGLPTPPIQPGSYAWFRGLYPPNAPGTNGMAPVPGMPEIRAPGTARAAYPPMPPMPAKAPGPVPAYPQAPKAADEWNLPPGMAQYYEKATTPVAPPPSPPMMGRNPVPAAMPMPGALPEGANPPGAMGMGDLAYPGAMTPPPGNSPAQQSNTATPRKPFDWGPDASLWSMLTQAGAAMMQPSYYGLGGQLSQGLTAAGEAAQKAPMQRLQKRMLEAQVGKVEGESAARQGLRDFAIQQNLPTGVALSLMLNPEKAAEILEKYDPAMKAAFLKFTEEKSGATAKGSFPYDILKAQASATNVNIKTQAEFAAKLEALAKHRADAQNPNLSPQARADAQKMADGIERGITQKDTPDAKFMEQIAGMERGVQGAERLRELVKKHGVSSLDPSGRAAIAQEYSWLITAMKQTEGFGAALTGNEQAILEAGLRNPNNFVNNALIGSQTHLKLIDKYIEFTRQRAQSYDRLRRTGALPPSLSEPPPPPSGFNRMGR